MSVVQQPPEKYEYVAKVGVTQFSLAKNIGLLSHSNSEFYTLEEGESFSIVLSDGALKTFNVLGIDKYQRIGYTFIDMKTNRKYTEREIFNKYYTGTWTTLQTCFTRNNDPFWGVMFIRGYENGKSNTIN